MALIDEEIIRAEIERIREIDYPCDTNEQAMGFYDALDRIEAFLDTLPEQPAGEISDGYHTFNELYYYRMLYNAAFFNLLPKEWVHKSQRHHTGEECFGGGWFIVMAELPTGQISNHYELKDWDLFQIPEKEFADEWDGHTPQEAADRLHKYLQQEQPVTDFHDLDSEIFAWQKAHANEDTAQVIAMTARHFAEYQQKQDQSLIELAEDHAILAGMNKMKEEMMEKAVEGYVNYYEDSGGILMAEAQVGCPYHNGDKVKIIVIKEEE